MFITIFYTLNEQRYDCYGYVMGFMRWTGSRRP